MELTVRADPRSWRLLDRLKLGSAFCKPQPCWRLPSQAAPVHSRQGLSPTSRLCGVADAALAGGAPEVAVRVADLTLERDPHNTRALVTKGDALYALGQRDEARAAYRQAVAIEPKLASAQLGLGRTLVQDRLGCRRGRPSWRPWRRSPDDSAALNDLGIARDLLGRHAEAQDAYRQALAITPASHRCENEPWSLPGTDRRQGCMQSGFMREAAAAPGHGAGSAEGTRRRPVVGRRSGGMRIGS